MKVNILSESDINGGAARAACRLHQGLQQIGVTSYMVVQTKFSDDRTIIAPETSLARGLSKLRPILNRLPLRFYRQRNLAATYSLQWVPNRMTAKISQLNPQVINLHWVCNGYLQIETIAKFDKPIIWTLHDMWAFTGGCHYSQQCDRYTATCGACPLLGSSQTWDVSRWVWRRKAKAWHNLNLTIVTPSTWLAKCAANSTLFKNLRIEVIPYGLDLKKYKPADKLAARNLLNLSRDTHLLLFGAMSATSDPRKGFHLLQPTLRNLSASGWSNKIELLVFGSSQPESPIDFGFKTHYLGQFSDDISLTVVYSAADVFIAPSLQDNLPNTVMEALACGTPCVAFNIGGMVEMIEHQKNGYLAHPFEVEDLAQGIAWVLQDRERYQKLSYRAREKVEQEFSQEQQARRYLTLFTEILDKNDKMIKL